MNPNEWLENRIKAMSWKRRIGMGCLVLVAMVVVVGFLAESSKRPTAEPRANETEQHSSGESPHNALELSPAEKVELLKQQQIEEAERSGTVLTAHASKVGSKAAQNGVAYTVHDAWWSKATDLSRRFDTDDQIEGVLCVDLELRNTTRTRQHAWLLVWNERGDEPELVTQKVILGQISEDTITLEGGESQRGVAMWRSTTGLRHLLVLEAHTWDKPAPQNEYLELSVRR